MNARTRMLVSLVLVSCAGTAMAETYKCTQNGKTMISDVPCASNASRVDQSSDHVSRSQQRHAEIVDARNRSQLAELESKARQERNYRGGVYVLPSPTSPADTPRRPR